MARVVRNDAEAEEDRLFISGLIQKGGADISCVDVWRLLNDRRSKLATEAALTAGKSQEEAERLAREARITVQSVRRDVRILVGRVQRAGMAGAAVFLDDQLASVRDEIESTYQMDEQIVQDLERSRSEVWERTTGAYAKKVVPATNGKPAEEKRVIEPTEIVRFKQEDLAGAASLYGRLQENMRRRAALRAEERLLRFGRQMMPEAEDQEEGERSLAEVVMELDDPDTARSAALRLMRREIRDLATASRLPLAGDMLKLDRLRVQGLESRIRQLREYVRSADEPANGGHQTYQVTFMEVAPRQLSPAPDGEGEEA